MKQITKHRGRLLALSGPDKEGTGCLDVTNVPGLLTIRLEGHFFAGIAFAPA